MPCKMVTRQCFEGLRETAASGDTHPHKKTTYTWKVEAYESTRKRLEFTLPMNHDEHTRGGRVQLSDSLHFGAWISSNAASDVNSGLQYKAAVDQELGEARENPCLADGQSEEQEGWCSGSTHRGKESPLCYVDGHLSSWECGVGTKAPKKHRTSGAPRRYSKRYKQTQYQLTIEQTWNTLQNISKFQNLNVHEYGYVFYDTSGQNLCQTSKSRWFLSNETWNGHPLAGLLWQRHFEESSSGSRMWKVPNWECLYTENKDCL